MRSRPNPRRKLMLEQLDARRLLAADVYHNFLLPEDVDFNGLITARDVLIPINAINDGIEHALAHLPDVNGDGRLTPIDPLIVLNGINDRIGDVVTSAVTFEARIDHIRGAIAENALPPHFDSDRAQEILDTLENGGLPELGEVITADTLSNLRDAISEGETPIADAVFNSLGIDSSDDVVAEVDSTLQSFGIDVSNTIDSVQSLIDTLPADTSQLGDQVIEILNHLGSEGSQLSDELTSLLNSSEVQAIAQHVESIIAEAEAEADSLQGRWHGLLSSLGTNGRSATDAALDLIDSWSANDGPLRDQILAVLQSEELDNFRTAVESELNAIGTDISNLQAAIDDFTARLAAGETPVRDWVASILSSSDPAAVATQLTAEGESLGENIDAVITSISDDATSLSQAVNNLVSDLTGGTSSVSQLVDDILGRVDSRDDIGSLVDGILSDVDGFLTNLFPGNDFLDSLLA